MLRHRIAITISQWRPEPLFLRVWHHPLCRDILGGVIVVLVVLFLVFYLEPAIRAGMER